MYLPGIWPTDLKKDKVSEMSRKHNPAPRRAFPPEFKAKLVLQLLTKERTVAELSREHGIRDTQIHQWRQDFLERAGRAFAPEEAPPESPKERCRLDELERLVGRQTMEIEVLKRALGK